MSVDVVVEQRIAAPRSRVAAFASDPANDTRWILALDSVRTLTEGEFGVGTRVERVAKFLGKRMEYVNEVVGFDQGRRVDMRSVRAPFPLAVTYEFEDLDGGAATLARIRTTGDGGGFYDVAAPLLSKMVRRGVARDLAALRGLMEAAPGSASGPA